MNHLKRKPFDKPGALFRVDVPGTVQYVPLLLVNQHGAVAAAPIVATHNSTTTLPRPPAALILDEHSLT